MDSHHETPEDLSSFYEKHSIQYPQGHPLGPPVKDWVFDAEIEAVKALIRLPTEITKVEADDLYCICRGTDDGRKMIHCSSEEKCFYGWFHTKCIGMRHLPDDDEEWYCEGCCRRLKTSAHQNQEVSSSVPSLPDSDASFLVFSSETSSSPVSARGKRARTSEASPPRKKQFSKPAVTEDSNQVSAESNLMSPEHPLSWKTAWEAHETEAMISSMKELVEKGAHKKCSYRWNYVSESLAKQGINRSWSSVRMAWVRFGRAMSGIDEREHNRGGPMSVGRRKSK